MKRRDLDVAHRKAVYATNKAVNVNNPVTVKAWDIEDALDVCETNVIDELSSLFGKTQSIEFKEE